MSGPLWIFGYGSLVWRPDFPHAERRPGFVEGWSRRFWQGSTDHRGRPGAPGRVVTLVAAPRAVCWGVAYRVGAPDREAVLGALDHREQGGFERRAIRVRFPEPEGGSVGALVYVAGPSNPNYLGPATPAAIAEQVRRAAGPSGSNRAYVLRLAEALRSLRAHDPHVFDLAARVRADG